MATDSPRNKRSSKKRNRDKQSLFSSSSMLGLTGFRISSICAKNKNSASSWKSNPATRPRV